jgi:hypothetical protein
MRTLPAYIENNNHGGTDDSSVPENFKDIRIYCCNSVSNIYHRGAIM